MKKHIQFFYKKILSTEGRKALIENFFSLTFLQIIALIIPIITTPYLIRVIGPEKFGLISFAQAFVQYFVILTDYGFNFSATREISIHKEDIPKVSAIFNAILGIKFLVFLIGLFILGLVLLFFEKFRMDWPLYLISFCALLGSVLFPIFVFQGMEKMKYILFCNLISLVFTLGIFIFVKTEQDYLNVVWINALGAVTAGTFSLMFMSRKFKLSFSFPEPTEVRHQLKIGWSIFLSSVAGASYNNSRIFALGLFSNNTLTGYYAVAEKMMMLIITFPLGLLIQAAYPRLGMLFQKDREGVRRLVQKFQKFTTLGYLVELPVLFFFAPFLVRLFCGAAYPEVIISLRWLLLGIFLIAANGFRIHSFLIYGQSEVFARICIACGFLGAFSTFFLTYIFSYLGTAWSVMINSGFALWLSLKEERRVCA